MAITVLEGSTFRMLSKDKRVSEVLLANNRVQLVLNPPWGVLEADLFRVAMVFDNWEAARNWVRKAVDQVPLV